MALPRDDIPVFCLGLSHHSAPVELLEKVTLPQDRLADALEGFTAPGARNARPAELVILSTCNRFEIFGSLADGTFETAFDFLCTRAALPRAALQPVVHRLTGREAAARLYRITSGLDSMVIGESQIVGQVAAAYAAAQAARRARRGSRTRSRACRQRGFQRFRIDCTWKG